MSLHPANRGKHHHTRATAAAALRSPGISDPNPSAAAATLSYTAAAHSAAASALARTARCDAEQPGALLLPTYSIRRTIWLLWFQGWAEAPWLVQEVAKSWKRHNPGWEVVQLDSSNLSKFMDTSFLFNPEHKMQPAAMSDMVSDSVLLYVTWPFLVFMDGVGFF
jgi:hypothetical protein